MIALVSTFTLLMFSVYKGINILYPLFAGLVLFSVIAHGRGFLLKELFSMILKGSKKSFAIINILLLIGAITAVWRASGTVAYVVYYGIKLMNPNYFILYAFLLSCLVSFLLGTSFGTVGTIGMILMVMVKGGDININLVAGAIIAGAYFGDRCSPMSSSANLVATLTETELYTNIRNMFRTSALPFGICVIIYGMLSFRNPLYLGESRISEEILSAFSLNWAVIIPALIILVLAAFRVEVKRSILVSIVCGMIITIVLQGESAADVVRYVVMGYSRPEQGLLADIMGGGGIVSMLNVTLIVLVSFALSGVFEGTALLKDVEGLIIKLGGRLGIFAALIITGIMAGSFGCSQTLAVMLTYQLVRNMYTSAGIDKYRLAVDLEDTVIVLSALVPWNIAGAVPAAALGADSTYPIYAYYLYLLPLIGLAVNTIRLHKQHNN
ncbi:MAG TPA: Na+/H+ antiporter NhaC family protein [Clostridia bacterium]|nr:Na+/H+ antiporter NhaC family protein [Clostridia bacterium]